MSDTTDRPAELASLADRADVLLVLGSGNPGPHYADPAAVITLCRQGIDRGLTDEEKARASALCTACEAAARRIAADREAEAAKDRAPIVAPRVHRFDNTEEAYNATQCNEAIRDGDVLVIASAKVVGFLHKAWPVALTEEHGELHGLTSPVADFKDGKYAASARVADEEARKLGISLLPAHTPAAPSPERIDDMLQVANAAATRVATDPDPEDPEWKAALDRLTAAQAFLVEHHPAYRAGVEAAKAADVRRKGSAPRHFDHPDAVAARTVLRGMKAAELTDAHDITAPDGEEQRGQRGFAVEPRGHGLVAVYWLERGLARRRDDEWHGPALDAVYDRFKDAGWAAEPLRVTSRCVYAHRPVSDA